MLANWRACHLYPINTFQATLRARVKQIDQQALVAQRLKRAPSISAKLRRFRSMKLAQMQDIGGLRAVLASPKAVRRLERVYRDPAAFQHELVSSKDYIASPKADGYRSLHLVYRYVSDRAPQYNGLQLELQFRTRMQHNWATAVETLGTFLGQALKSGEGNQEWRQFFTISSAAFAHLEQSPAVPGFEDWDADRIYREVDHLQRRLKVLRKLGGFAIAADSISSDPRAGKYNLVILETASRSVMIRPFSESRLEEATTAYAEVEARALAGEQIEAVLVSAGPISMLKKAYPNYFLDTQAFMNTITRVMNLAKDSRRPRRKRPLR